MERYQMRVIAWLLYISVALLVVPAYYCFVRWLAQRSDCSGCKKTGFSKILVFSAWLISAVWCLRYAVGYYAIITAHPGADTLTWGEEIFNSLVHALQTFSMDEDYTAYILDGKEMAAAVFGENSFWHRVYGPYASVLNAAAPIAGGAIVFEILAGMLPKLRLKFSYINIFRKKYFFSKLTPASLALAKDICRVYKKQWPLIVFTDAYVDDGNEKDHELVREAKQHGMICLSDDIVHVAKPRFGKREYYLMDENEFGNLQALMELAQQSHIHALANANIYLFVQSDAYVQIEKQVLAKLTQLEELGVCKAEKRPNIIPVHGYRNLVQNLLTEVPLYEPLVGKQEPEKLTVTVFGNGTIGTEAFLSIYWFGQLLVSKENTMRACDLTVNVVSQDSPEAFWAKIDYINPEIRQTVQILEGASVQTPGDILRYDAGGHKNKPYCAVRYIRADIKIGGFMDGETQDARRVLDADYFILALGSDADNISVAQKLRRTVGKNHLETAGGNTVIAYAVFDENLAKALNEHKRYQLRDGKKTDLYMHAFGSLEQVYSCDNVYMSQSARWAEETGSAYQEKLHDGSHVADNRDRAKGGENSDYNYWANLARAAHIKYKVFSLGWIGQSVFSAGNDHDPVDADAQHREYIRQCCRKYKAVAIGENFPENTEARTLKQDIEDKKHCLAWLEHRRWNAFTRTMGYQHVPAENLFGTKGSQKDMPLKLHSCLVEAKWPAMEDKQIYMPEPAAGAEAYGRQDYLDYVSWVRLAHKEAEWAEKEAAGKKPDRTIPDDFKKYDYYTHEFGGYFTEQQMAKLFATDVQTVRSLCRRGCFAGAEHFELTDTWQIPEGTATALLKKGKEGKACTIRNLWIRLVLNCRKTF